MGKSASRVDGIEEMRMNHLIRFFGSDEALLDENSVQLADENGKELLVPSFVESYDNSKIVGITCVQERDPIGLKLPYGSATAKIAAAADANLVDAVRMQIYRGGKICGTYYAVQGSNNLRGMADVGGADALILLDSVQFLGRFLGAVSAVGLIAEICGDAGVPVEYGVTHLLDSNGEQVALADVVLSGYIHGGTGREALRKICLATGLIPIVTKNGTIRFVSYQSAGTPIAYTSVVYGLSLKQSAYYSRLVIYWNKYVLDTKSDKETVISETLDSGSYRYVFDDPHANYVGTNCTITSSGSNFVEFNVLADAKDVEIKGSKYKKITLTEAFDNPVQTGATNVYVLKDTEVSSNVGGVMQRLYRYICGATGKQTSLTASLHAGGTDEMYAENMELTTSANGDTMQIDVESAEYSLDNNDTFFAKVKGTRRIAE